MVVINDVKLGFIRDGGIAYAIQEVHKATRLCRMNYMIKQAEKEKNESKNQPK